MTLTIIQLCRLFYYTFCLTCRYKVLVCHANRSQTIGSKRFNDVADTTIIVGAIKLLHLVSRLDKLALAEDHFTCALAKETERARNSGMSDHSRHAFARRIERVAVDVVARGVRLADLLVVAAQLLHKAEQTTLGFVAELRWELTLHPSWLNFARVVAVDGDGGVYEVDEFAINVARSRERLIDAVVHVALHAGHAAGGQSSRHVGTDGSYIPNGLTSVQVTDQVVIDHHFLDSECHACI